jgi:hypothetical protein
VCGGEIQLTLREKEIVARVIASSLRGGGAFLIALKGIVLLMENRKELEKRAETVNL